MDDLIFDKSDIDGEYAEFSFPKGPIDLANPKEYHDKSMKGSLSQSEKEIYYNYLLANLSNGTEEEAEEIYIYLISNSLYNYYTEDIVFIGLYSIYLEYKKEKYNDDGTLKKGYEELNPPSLKIYKKFHNPDIAGMYTQGSKKVSIANECTEIRYLDSILSYMSILFHETRHYIQEYESEHGILNPSSLSSLTNDGRSRCNYLYRTEEMDADEHSYRTIVEIINRHIKPKVEEQYKFLLTIFDKSQADQLFKKKFEIIDLYSSELEILLRGKAIAFSKEEKLIIKDINGKKYIVSKEDIIRLTDISDITFILEEAKKISKSNNPQKREKFIDKLTKITAIPKIFAINKENVIVLQTEENLLKGYSSAKEGEKEVYEMALKYLYTYKSDEKEDFVKEDSYYTISELKLHFIEEQISKERDFLNQIKLIQKNQQFHSFHVYDSEVDILKVINEIINIRLKRIKYYSLFLKLINSMLFEEIENLYNEFKEVNEKLSSNSEINEILNDSYHEDNNDYDFSNIINNK